MIKKTKKKFIHIVFFKRFVCTKTTTRGLCIVLNLVFCGQSISRKGECL